MPVSRLAVGLLLVGVLPAFADAPSAPPPRVKVAILEIRPLGTEQVKADLLSEIALTEAYGIGGIDVIGRSDIASMLGFEQQKKVLGCADDPSCIAEIGGALGTEYLLVGSLGRLGNLFRIDLKLVETRKAQVRGRFGESIEAREEALAASVQRGVRQLLQPIGAARLAASAPPAQVSVRPAPDLVPARPSPATVATRAQPARSGRRTTAWVTGGAGVALAAGGAVAGLAARGAFDDEKAAAAKGDAAAYDDARSKVKTLSRAADAMFVGGAVCLGVSAWLFLAPDRPHVALTAAPLSGGAVAVASGEF
jgi:TolB-like protein